MPKTYLDAPNIHTAFSRLTRQRLPTRVETKRQSQVLAPAFIWGPWLEIYAQFGVIGANADRHVTTVEVSFETRTEASATFDVEIEGGDELVTAIGPGSVTVKISGNVAIALRLRARSHLTAQNIIITAQ